MTPRSPSRSVALPRRAACAALLLISLAPLSAQQAADAATAAIRTRHTSSRPVDRVWYAASEPHVHRASGTDWKASFAADGGYLS